MFQIRTYEVACISGLKIQQSYNTPKVARVVSYNYKGNARISEQGKIINSCSTTSIQHSEDYAYWDHIWLDNGTKP